MIEMTDETDEPKVDPWPPSDDDLSEQAEGLSTSDAETHQSQSDLEEARTAKQPTSDEEA